MSSRRARSARPRRRSECRQALVGHLGRQPDVEIETERPGDLLTEETAERPVRGVGAADRAPACRARSSSRDSRAACRAARPASAARARARRRRGRAAVRSCSFSSSQTSPASWPRSWRTVIGFLAALRELGPVARDRRVVVEPAARVRDRERHRGDALRGRDDERPSCPRSTVRLPRRAAAAPQIDHLLAAPVRDSGRADLATLGEVALERPSSLHVPQIREGNPAGLPPEVRGARFEGGSHSPPPCVEGASPERGRSRRRGHRVPVRDRVAETPAPGFLAAARSVHPSSGRWPRTTGDDAGATPSPAFAGAV